MVPVMKEHSDHLRTARFLKIQTAVATILLAGFAGCSSSSLKTSAGDAATASGGQAGSATSSGTASGDGGSVGPVGGGGVSTGGTIGTGGAGGSIQGGAGGTIGPGGEGGASAVATGGSGGTNGPGGAGGIGGTGGACASFRMCNGGDSQLGYGGFETDPSVGCPTGRECYVLQYECGNTFCMLPEGVHCADKLTCNPGDIETSFDDRNCTEAPDLCYIKQLCANYIWCKDSMDAGAAASESGANGDAPAAATGVDASALNAGYCGDGIIDMNLNEGCDLGNLNGLCLDYQSRMPLDSGVESPVDAGCPLGSFDWDGTPVCNCPSCSMVFCTTSCQYPVWLP